MHTRIAMWIVGLASGLLFGCAGQALAASIDEPAELRLVSEHQELIPGQIAYLGLCFEIQPGWHLYWDGLNTTGFPPTIVELDLPAGYEAKALQWPVPKRHIDPGRILDHIYEKQLTVILPILVPSDAPADLRVTISAKVEWLVCKEVCLPGRAAVLIDLPVMGAGETGTKSKDAPLFEKARSQQARQIPKRNSPVTVEWASDTLVIRAIDATGMTFYPGRDSPAPIDMIRDCTSRSQALRIPYEIGPKSPARVKGIIEITRGPDEPPLAFTIDLARPEAHERDTARTQGDN